LGKFNCENGIGGVVALVVVLLSDRRQETEKHS